jgi:hypothetical protein
MFGVDGGAVDGGAVDGGAVDGGAATCEFDRNGYAACSRCAGGVLSCSKNVAALSPTRRLWCRCRRSKFSEDA